MSWFVVFLASVFIVSTSGYDERLLVCKGFFLGGGGVFVSRLALYLECFLSSTYKRRGCVGSDPHADLRPLSVNT